MAWLRRGLGGDTRHLLPEMAATGCFVGLIWFCVAITLNHEYEHAAGAAVQATGNLARAFEESTKRTIGELDQTLLSARAFYAAQGDRFDITQWALTQSRPDKMTVQIGLMDLKGDVFASTLPIPPNGIHVGDRAYFQAQLDPSRDDLYISRPVLGRGSQKETIQVTRKLFGPNGQIAGVITASIDCYELSRFYQTLSIGNGYVSLEDNDGIILARGPVVPGLIGSNIADGPLFSAGTHQYSGASRLRSTLDGVERIVSYRRLADYPLTVAVGFDTDSVFEHYNKIKRRALLTGGVSTTIVLLLGMFWISQRKRSLAAKRALSVTLESISQGILMVDEHGRLPVINQRAIDLLGVPHGTPTTDAAALLASANLVQPPSRESALTTTPGQYVPVAGKCEQYRRDGTIVEITSHPLRSGGVVQTFTDVTEQRHAEARTRFIAHHDSITGLPNRVRLKERLAELIEQGVTEGKAIGFVMIDLDGFKSVNDTLGHVAGDLLLVEVAQRLQSLIGPNDIVARIGGDEFVILQPNISDTNESERLARAILARLAEPSSVAGQQVAVGASIGLAFYPRDGLDGDTLLMNADIALYRVKAEGRGNYQCFHQWMVASLHERRALEQDLRMALENDELDLHFQPQFSSQALEITGFEALLRWRHPIRGVVPPALFIPIAEDCGLIADLGRWVMERACAEAIAWLPQCRVAINVSPAQFKDSRIQRDLADILARTGLSPHLLEIEVTEGVLVSDDQQVLETLRNLKAQGIRVSLDDFGTGYSSLSYLQRFPFDKIKIDKSFVQQQTMDSGARAIVDAILLMSRHLGLDVVAEGVETEQQLATLRAQGCTEVQGFLVGVPLPAKSVAEFIRRQGQTEGTRDGQARELQYVS